MDALLRTIAIACALLTLAPALPAAAVEMGGPTVLKAKESGCPTGKFFCFDPGEVTVPSGQATFRLDNTAGQAGHNLCIVVGAQTTCAPGPSPTELAPPGSNNATLTVTLAAGKYEFYCAPHRTIGMSGNITATPGSSPPPSTPPPSGTPPSSPPPSTPPPASPPPSSGTPGFDVALLALAAVGVALAARRRGGA